MARKLSRRSFLEVALAGGALGTANLTLMSDVYAQASGPIVIGHHCDLTGVISSWGLWHDKAAKAAVDIINQGGGIAGRKVELATEDTESNPASGARKLRNLIQRARKHNVTAERFGLLGEMRAELSSGVHSPHHVSMREWLDGRD